MDTSTLNFYVFLLQLTTLSTNLIINFNSVEGIFNQSSQPFVHFARYDFVTSKNCYILAVQTSKNGIAYRSNITF